MAIIDLNQIDFVKELASSAPVPGGGGAAALAGAIGTALGNMVGSLTLGKKKYADVQDEIVELKKRADDLQDRLLELVDEDAEGFLPLANAYRMPNVTEDDKAKRAEAIEAGLSSACRVPFDIMKCAAEAIDVTERFAEIGSRLAISDAGVSALLLKGALQSAKLNVIINTSSMKDREAAEDLERKADELERVYVPKADAIYEKVLGVISK